MKSLLELCATHYHLGTGGLSFAKNAPFLLAQTTFVRLSGLELRVLA